ETDPARIHAFIRNYAFGALIAAGDRGEVEIAHIPFLFDSDKGNHGELRTHVARANPIWKLAIDGRPLTVVFNGPHGYVSPRFYERPTEQVPTWNYTVVHVHGRARGAMNDEELALLLGDLSAEYEHGAPEPWRLSHLDIKVRDQLMREIVGISIAIER